jgi:hypothetical protein
MSFVPAGCDRERATKHKKTDAAKHPEAFNHVGLLVNGPPGTSGLPFI